MSAASAWLADRISSAPESLREAMLAALDEVNEAPEIHEHLAQAATVCLERAMSGQTRREKAMDLLAADALMTHACEAAAEPESENIEAFAAAWDAARFEQILPAVRTGESS